MAILDIAPFDDLRATPDSRPPHVIAHQLNHIGMPHALARRKVRRLRVNVKTSVFDRLDIRIAHFGQRYCPQRTLLGTPQKRHARLFEQIVNHTGQAGERQRKTALVAIGQARGILVSEHLLIEDGKSRQFLDRHRLCLVNRKQDALARTELLETLVDQPSQCLAFCPRRLDRHPAKRRPKLH